MAEHLLVITAVVTNHTNNPPLPPPLSVNDHSDSTMDNMELITWAVMGLGCLVLTLCILLAAILIYQHCRCRPAAATRQILH
jgi:hypothetical protein